ncbi:MAG: helix-turn-helix domain-containing protein, partial [Gammaproteobacteria bacterium]
VLSRTQQSKTEVAKRSTRGVVGLTQVVKTVAHYYGVSTDQITMATRGRGPKNIPRWIAMKLCQDYSGKTLNEIAVHFNVSHYCTVSQTIGRLNRILKAGRRLQRELTTISQDLTPQYTKSIFDCDSPDPAVAYIF